MAETIRLTKCIKERLKEYREEQRKTYLKWIETDKDFEKELIRLDHMSDSDLIEQALWMAIAQEKRINEVK